MHIETLLCFCFDKMDNFDEGMRNRKFNWCGLTGLEDCTFQ